MPVAEDWLSLSVDLRRRAYRDAALACAYRQPPSPRRGEGIHLAQAAGRARTSPTRNDSVMCGRLGLRCMHH